MIWLLQFSIFGTSNLQSCIFGGNLSELGKWDDAPTNSYLLLTVSPDPMACELIDLTGIRGVKALKI